MTKSLISIIFYLLFIGSVFAQSPTISNDVPHDVTNSDTAYPDVSLSDLATFAWQEFVALNHPADPNHRGQPKPGSKLGDPADAVVWESYWHRVELFPYNESPARNGNSPIVTGGPSYVYDPAAFTLDQASYGGDGTAPNPNTIWNNLDENNELNVDEMFAHVSLSGGEPSGFTDENRILYEAKMNEDGFAYILEDELYKTAIRDTYVATSALEANLKTYGSQCGVTQANITSLPCGKVGGPEGNIEVKAAWKKLSATEASSGKYYTNKVIRYQSISNVSKWFVDTYGLVGLHIIHKTVNFPSFVYATFEHIDNIQSGIGYIDEIAQTGRGSGDTPGDKVIIKNRDNPIPVEVMGVNSTYRKAVANSVWANYQLVGVQAYPVDYAELGTSASDISTYYLANIVIESNEELQNFRGKKPAGTKDVDNMYTSGKSLNMGGCMGCHGVGQLKGGDFNFLIVNSPFGAPEVVGASGTISFRDINNYNDVQAMFSDYVKLNGIAIGSSPHLAFWQSLSYADFTTGNVPNVGPPAVKLVDCGNAKGSAIVEILQGAYTDHGSDIEQMPAGGPYFPEEQVERFAKWVDADCPNPVTFPVPPFANPIAPVKATSADDWARKLLSINKTPQTLGTFNESTGGMTSVSDSDLQTVLAEWEDTKVNVVSIVAVKGPGAPLVDVAVYSDISGKNTQYQGWNGVTWVSGPATPQDGVYWYRAVITSAVVFYAKTYRQSGSKEGGVFQLWAYQGKSP